MWDGEGLNSVGYICMCLKEYVRNPKECVVRENYWHSALLSWNSVPGAGTSHGLLRIGNTSGLTTEITDFSADILRLWSCGQEGLYVPYHTT